MTALAPTKYSTRSAWEAWAPSLVLTVAAERFTDRFELESCAAASLNHPNICTLHDVGPNYLVMEMVEGETPAARIRHWAIPLEEGLRIARQIADALEAGHAKGIVHRDLTPANLQDLRLRIVSAPNATRPGCVELAHTKTGR